MFDSFQGSGKYLSNAFNSYLRDNRNLPAHLLRKQLFLFQSEVVLKVGSKNPVLETIKALLDRAAPLLVDEQCIKKLFKLVKDAVEGLSDYEDDEYEWHESSGSRPVGKKGLDLLLVSLNSCN